VSEGLILFGAARIRIVLAIEFAGFDRQMVGFYTLVTLLKRASALSAYVDVLNLGKRARALSRSIFWSWSCE
jgi:hypothetical protein